MKRLIEKGLMFGNLFHVESPALVERYRRALRHLAGKDTELTDFHIDISGYSPEIGDELGDHLYLNHNGVNRQFILLSTEQKRAPLLNAKFSTSRDILQRFIAANEAQLFALTAADAVAGELVNSVYSLNDPTHLLDLRQIEIEADTPGGTIANATELARLIDRFKSEEDAWFDDGLIGEMIDLAKRTGDISRNPVRLKSRAFEQRNFWTAHFGGLYLFPHSPHPAAIAAGGTDAAKGLAIEHVFALDQRRQIAKFLELNELVRPVLSSKSSNAAIIRQKMDFIIIDTAADAGMDLTGLDRTGMRRLARQHADRLPPEFHGLNALYNWATRGGKWPRINSDHPAYFYTLRAAGGPDRDLVNMLLAELTQLDFRQLFICHKALFYRLYQSWPEAKKAYATDFLEREYAVDKAGAREALFGDEPDMSGAPEPPRIEKLVDQVGPWGAVRRR